MKGYLPLRTDRGILTAKCVFALFWVLLPSILMVNGALADFQKTKIAVLDFQLQGKGYETEDMGRIVSEWMITALVKEGRFEVVERRLLEKVINEQKLATSGLVDESSTTQLGRILGVKIIISGSILKLHDTIEVNARIIDVQTALIIAAESIKSTSTTRLEELIARMAEKIIKDFPLEGYIVNRKGEIVLIDIGRYSGVKNGMRFMVFKEGGIIRHPKTGEILDMEKIQTGFIKIVAAKEKISEAKVIEEQGAGSIDYGQMVKSISDLAVTRLSSDAGSPSESPEKAKLVIEPNPKEAFVRILNIVPRYYDGIELDPGRYHVEISALGYLTKTVWVELTRGEEKHLPVDLQPISPASITPGIKPAPVATAVDESKLSPEINRIIGWLQSYDSRAKRKGAKYVYEKYPNHSELLRVVNEELLKGYQKDMSSSWHHEDAMALLCMVLGKSGKSEFKKTLEMVIKETPSVKVRKHAAQNLKKLNQ